MELIDIFALFSCVLLVVCGLYYGAAFVRRKTTCLAWNFDSWYFRDKLYDLHRYRLANQLRCCHFLDAFSRGVGVPIVGTLGLMAVTHGYKPSPAKDFILFLAAFSVTAIYFLSTAFKPWLPYFYVLMWALYTLYLLYFIWCLVRAGEFLHALATLLGAQGDDCAEV